MANGKDGSDKKDQKPGAKPGAGGQDPKKPTPIIDLKATEVKSSPDKDDKKPASSSTEAAKPIAGAAAAGKPADAKPTTTSSASAAGAKPGSSGAGQGIGKTAPDGKNNPAAGQGKSAGGTAATDNKPSDKARQEQSAAPRSGGGMLGFVTHMAAGIVGGALVLLGAQPIEQQLGTEFLPRAELPAELNTRLAALEQRPAPTAGADLSEVTAGLASLRAKIAGLDEVRQQVAKLSAGGSPAPTQDGAQAPASPSAASSAAPQSDELLARVTKLEQTLDTLASATGGSGQPTDGARLAAISGRIVDIETTLTNQITALRESVSKELEDKVGKSSEAAAAAQAGTKRIDRELSQIKTEAARLEQRAETIKAAQASLDQAVRVAREEAAKLRVDLDGLKGDVTQQFSSVAKPADVKSAVAPIAGKLTSIEKQMAGILESENARKTNAQRIVMALELGNLKRVVARGGPYAAELGEVKRMAGGSIDLSALEKFQAAGVPTASDLQREFSKLAYSIINANDEPASDKFLDRLIGGAKSLVRVRRADLPATDTSVEATVARIETLLKQGNLVGAMDEAKKLPEASAKPAAPWLERVAARAEVDRAIADIESKLKSSLGSPAATKG